MQDVQEQAISNYQENMEFFKEKHEDLHNKLFALDIILNKGDYTQKYDLEYQDGYFDVIELETNHYLYNKDSNQYSESLLDSVSYKKNDQVFETQRIYNFDDNAVKYFREQDDVYQHFSTSAEIINYYNTYIDKSDEMIYLDKYIFFGTGLGIHIEKITTKFDLQVILIIEDNIELFRLSLFTCNYKKLSQNRDIFFSVAQNRQEFHFRFHKFYDKAFIKNHFIKFTIFSSMYHEKIRDVQSLLVTRPEATYSNERILQKNKRVLDKLTKKYKFLDTTKKVNETFFKDKPFLVLGAGPSLHKNEDWLKQHCNDFIIIAAFASLKTLKRIGVVPDIVAQIDENDETTFAMLENLGDLDFIKNSICMFSASIPEIMFKTFNKENIYLHEDRTVYKGVGSRLVVASVGETIYSLALIFNAYKVYLLGLDLALGDEGESHSPDHFKQHKKTIENDSNEENENKDYHLHDQMLKTKGNLRSTVNTTPLLAMSIPVINLKTANLKSAKQTIYNMSDGAYFENTTPLLTSDYKSHHKIDKNNISSQLKSFFDSYSTNELSEKEKLSLKTRQNFIDELHDLIESFKSKPSSNTDAFYLHFIKLINLIMFNQYNNELKEALGVFCLRTVSFLADFYNTKNIKNLKKHNKKIQQLLVKQLTKQVNAYEKELHKMTEEV